MIGTGRPLPMPNRHARLCLATIFLICTAGGASAAEDPRIENAKRAFAILDMDGDGNVTNDEFANRKIEAFSSVDRNDDNYLSAEEVHITPEQFSKIDRDGDGKISGVEFIDSPYGQFVSYDMDKNAVVELRELARLLAGQ
jgi:Ca2+-binding EF-hand superfamily protein